MSEREDVIETVDVQTVAVTTPANVEPVGTDLNKVRELVLKAHPDVVPDLVRGGSVDELIASVEPARSAYQRIAERVEKSRGREVEESRSREEQPPVVPAGGAAPVVDPTNLAPTTKIAQALAARKKQ